VRSFLRSYLPCLLAAAAFCALCATSGAANVPEEKAPAPSEESGKRKGSSKTTVQYPRPLAGNPHIKLLTYNEKAIHYYKGFFGYESSILFEPGEEFEVIAMGDTKAWQLNPMENRLFLKPLDSGADTNVTIITKVRSQGERRIYLFHFQAGEAKGADDEELAYEVRMVYPMIKGYGNGGDYSPVSSGSATLSNSDIPDATNPSLNYNYSIAGNEKIRPVRVFDDGKFTYLQFAKDSELPAIFLVDDDGYESLINFRKVDDYIVIEQVASLFSLRKGESVGCLFNESRPYVVKAVKKRSRGVFMKSE
jgi:type IV secretion system protein VirB9